MDTERIVFVRADGTPSGKTGPKLGSHHARTPLHLGFSCYVFNRQGQFLATRRAATKKVWPGVWTNSVCGHPAPGETLPAAIRRRMHQELGLRVTNIKVVLPTYRYRTPPFQGIIENEFCPVYVARTALQPTPKPAEVADYRWLSWPEFVDAAAADREDAYSWWCKDQLRHLQEHPLILRYSRPLSAKVDG